MPNKEGGYGGYRQSPQRGARKVRAPGAEGGVRRGVDRLSDRHGSVYFRFLPVQPFRAAGTTQPARLHRFGRCTLRHRHHCCVKQSATGIFRQRRELDS